MLSALAVWKPCWWKTMLLWKRPCCSNRIRCCGVPSSNTVVVASGLQIRHALSPFPSNLLFSSSHNRTVFRKDGFCSCDLEEPARHTAEPRDGPTQNFHKKNEKIPPDLKVWTPRKVPPIYPENTEKKHPRNTKMPVLGLFFFWCFRVVISGSRISARRVLFLYFCAEIPGWDISGLCSRSGHSQLRPRLPCWLKVLQPASLLYRITVNPKTMSFNQIFFWN